MLGVIFALTNFVSAGERCEISIVSPTVGSYQNDDIYISWQTANCTSSSYDLYYREGSCDIQHPLNWTVIDYLINGGSYSWESGIDQGEFCIKVEESGSDGIGTMDGLFFIDNLNPEADAGGPYECDEGMNISLNASGSSDNYGISFYSWDLDGDEVYDDWYGPSAFFDCADGPSVNDVSVMVMDYAGNTDTDDAEVEVHNVAPICEGISGPTDILLGMEATFMGYGSDVPADVPLIFNWDFGDGEVADDENPVNHTYEEAGLFNVTLTVEDGDDGSDICLHEIGVVEPTVLDAQEVAAYYPLVSDFGGEPNQIPTGLDGFLDCEKIAGPANLMVFGVNDSCEVRWEDNYTGSANPINDERGTHNVIVRASLNGSFLGNPVYEYYTFDVTVWSWIIHLNEGWNLISIPLVPEFDNSIENVFLDQLYDSMPGGTTYTVVSYQRHNGVNDWYESRRSGYGALNEVMPGYGYGVLLNEPATLRGNGVKRILPNPNPNILVPRWDWSMIGKYGILGTVPGLHGSLPEDVALDNVDDSLNTLHTFELDGDEVNDLFNNEGYWLLVENDLPPANEESLYTPTHEDDPYNDN